MKISIELSTPELQNIVQAYILAKFHLESWQVPEKDIRFTASTSVYRDATRVKSVSAIISAVSD